jgi:hypothetical protein
MDASVIGIGFKSKSEGLLSNPGMLLITDMSGVQTIESQPEDPKK